jgi:hypothetical protein
MLAAAEITHAVEYHHPELSPLNRTPALFFSSVKTGERYLDFFTSNIPNRNTRTAYFKATPTGAARAG